MYRSQSAGKTVIHTYTVSRDDTLFLFFSDYGDGLTSHRMVTKQVSFYEEVTRIPLIVLGPGVAGANRVVARPLVSLLDLVPTLCDWAGLETPGGLAGYSLRPWLEGRDSLKYPNHEGTTVPEWTDQQERVRHVG